MRPLAAVFLLILTASTCGGEPADPLASALGRGGHVLFLRHAATNAGIDTTADPAECSAQRNLSDAGRRDAEEIGRHVQRLGLPIDQVLASPLCRTMDTARLAFGAAEPDERLLQSAAPTDLAALISDAPQQGVRVLVGHQAALHAAVGVDLEEGETAVFGPDGGLVTTLDVGDWADLGR